MVDQEWRNYEESSKIKCIACCFILWTWEHRTIPIFGQFKQGIMYQYSEKERERERRQERVEYEAMKSDKKELMYFYKSYTKLEIQKKKK